MRWKNFGETTTEEGHKAFFRGKAEKHEHGVGFLVQKDIVNTVMGCRPVSCRLITIHLRAVRFNITIVQTYSPTSDYDDNEIEKKKSMTSHRMSLIRHRRQTFLLCKETGMQEWARMLMKLARHLRTLLQ